MVPEVIVEKVDSEKKEPLTGAEFVVEDMEGNSKDRWVSDGTPHVVEGLEPETSYVLKEMKAPEG